MKIVFISDVHLDAQTLGVSRFPELKRIISHAAERAIKEEAMFVFGGDLMDPDGGSAVFGRMEFVIRTALALASYGITSCWMAGNHDVIENGEGFTTLSPLRALAQGGDQNELVHVFEMPGTLEINGTRLVFLPFTASDRGVDLQEFVDTYALPDKKNIVFGHLTIPGVQPGEETTDYPRGREILYPEVKHAHLRVAGHYHRYQVTYEGIHIVGTPARLTFGEEENIPGYFLIDTESGKVDHWAAEEARRLVTVRTGNEVVAKGDLVRIVGHDIRKKGFDEEALRTRFLAEGAERVTVLPAQESKVVVSKESPSQKHRSAREVVDTLVANLKERDHVAPISTQVMDEVGL